MSIERNKQIVIEDSALATGGTWGIGRGIVRELAREGAKVLFCGRHVRSPTELMDEFGTQGYAVEADVTTVDIITGANFRVDGGSSQAAI
jgi:NADP-dependent 3-hydroxy acid dehydrogenase YdfG